MATITSRIPHGSLLAQLRQRQMDEYNAAEEKRKQKAAFTNQITKIVGMGAGAALGTTIFPGMGTAAGMMAGAGLGGTGGGLMGNAMTGTPVSMNQGVNALMQVGGLMQRDQQLGINQQRADALGGAYDPAGESLSPTIAGAQARGYYGPMGAPYPEDPGVGLAKNQLMQDAGYSNIPGAGMQSAMVNNLVQQGKEATWLQNNPDMGAFNLADTPGGKTTITREIGNRKSTIEGGIPTKIVEKTSIPGGTETTTFAVDPDQQNKELTEIEAYLISQGQQITPQNIAAVRAMISRR